MFSGINRCRSGASAQLVGSGDRYRRCPIGLADREEVEQDPQGQAAVVEPEGPNAREFR
jgi:hypothetical protein